MRSSIQIGILGAIFGALVAVIAAAPVTAQGGDNWAWYASPGACAWEACDAEGAAPLAAGGSNSIQITTCYTQSTSLLIGVASDEIGTVAVSIDDVRADRSHYIEDYGVVRIPATGEVTGTLEISSVGPYTSALSIRRLEARCILPRASEPLSSLSADAPGDSFGEIAPYDFHRTNERLIVLGDINILDWGRQILRVVLTLLVLMEGSIGLIGLGLLFVLPVALIVVTLIIRSTTEQGY
jgi:hypothetical protein